jgi:hypothetical protein
MGNVSQCSDVSVLDFLGARASSPASFANMFRFDTGLVGAALAAMNNQSGWDVSSRLKPLLQLALGVEVSRTMSFASVLGWSTVSA